MTGGVPRRDCSPAGKAERFGAAPVVQRRMVVVTRIVAGSLGGRRLQVPQRGTRPTSERVREAVFNSLEAMLDLDGARVLDLYGGSGAMGLEALSRGAEHALFIESDRRAADTLRGNIRSLGQQRSAAVAVVKAESALAAPADAPYDAVLADPPYALTGAHLREVLEGLVTGGWVAPGSIVVMEQSTRGEPWEWPEPLRQTRLRRYGETVVYWAVHDPVEVEDGTDGEDPAEAGKGAGAADAAAPAADGSAAATDGPRERNG